jgi:L-ascorbate metabolism protein UlaG (beta-lactamase superfamily)
MNRRTLFKGAALLAGLATAGGTATAMKPARNRYYSGPVSDHFDGTRFFNPGGEVPRGGLDLLKWRFGGGRQKWPETVPVPARAMPAPAPAGTDLKITMVGHATMLIQTAGLNILTDPVWSDRASPLAFAGPRRVTEPGIAFADLPGIDLILLSHNHYDHLDLTTLASLHRDHAPRIITPLGNDAILKGDLPGARIDTRDWDQAVNFGPLTIHFEPCHHWSARGVGDRSMALWAAFVIEGPAGKILHIGDTGFDGGRPYARVREKHGAMDAAILPIGAYEPRWFMRAQHQNPEEAVEGFRLCGARHAVGHHWGTFQLTDEARDDPPKALAAALRAQGLAPGRFQPLAPGQAWTAPRA